MPASRSIALPDRLSSRSNIGSAGGGNAIDAPTGALIIGAYLVFLGSLLATAHSASPDPRLTVIPLVVVAAGAAAGLARRPGRKRGQERTPP